MRKCSNCGEDALPDRLMCANCHKLIYGTEVPKAQTSKRTSKKPRKPVQYVRLSHGRVMKKSTYDWMERKNSGVMAFIWLFFGISIFIALVQGCS